MMDRYTFQPHSMMNVPAQAPIRPTTEPTDRSMLPPVRMHSSMPMARMMTYAFWKMRLLTFMGLSSLPPVST